MATRESFGRYFEEFEPGDVIEHWPGRTITESGRTLKVDTIGRSIENESQFRVARAETGALTPICSGGGGSAPQVVNLGQNSEGTR